MKIIENSILPVKNFDAINLFGFVFVRHGVRLDDQMKRHEAIHTEQMKYMGYLFFYIWYGIEWLVRLAQYRNKQKAYFNVSFEREAYANDKHANYIRIRTRYAWTKYLKNPRVII